MGNDAYQKSNYFLALEFYEYVSLLYYTYITSLVIELVQLVRNKAG